MVLDEANLATVEITRLEAGPRVSGSLRADQEATVRAEVAGSVVAAFVEEGERVARGTLLARIDPAVLREARVGAESAVRSAQQQLEVARRNADRAESLLAAGALPPREAESAHWAVTQAESMLADARARLSLASEQLAKADVRAPIAGVVSRRGVSVGDTVAPGAELFTVVDPAVLRLDAAVPAEHYASLRVGAPVSFRANGDQGRVFEGVVDRINPVADAATRQIAIYAKLPNPKGELVPGLFVEGRLSTEFRQTASLPLSAIDRTQAEPSVLRVRDGVIERVAVQLGLSDGVLERVEIVTGLAAGDRVLLGAARSLAPGTAVRLRAVQSG
jgi:RND family efflux transporter MFP subunit